MAAQKKYPEELRARGEDGAGDPGAGREGYGEIALVCPGLDVYPEALRSWLQQGSSVHRPGETTYREARSSHQAGDERDV